MSRATFNTMCEAVAYLKNAGIVIETFNGWKAEVSFGEVTLADGRLYVNRMEVSKKRLDFMIQASLPAQAAFKQRMDEAKAHKIDAIVAASASEAATEEPAQHGILGNTAEARQARADLGM